MFVHRSLLISSLVASIAACGGGTQEDAASGANRSTANRPSGNGACALLMQGEVDELFGTSIGAGASESLDGDIEICSWPGGDEPALLLQLSPASGDIRQAVELGEGFHVDELDDLSGPAAVALEQADGDRAVAVLALSTGERTITLSPIGLGLLEGTPRFDQLKALVNEIASRL